MHPALEALFPEQICTLLTKFHPLKTCFSVHCNLYQGQSNPSIYQEILLPVHYEEENSLLQFSIFLKNYSESILQMIRLHFLSTGMPDRSREFHKDQNPVEK